MRYEWIVVSHEPRGVTVICQAPSYVWIVVSHEPRGVTVTCRALSQSGAYRVAEAEHPGVRWGSCIRWGQRRAASPAVHVAVSRLLGLKDVLCATADAPSEAAALTRKERLIACALVRTRFAGRAEIVRRAASSNVALATLELRLGLGTEAQLLEARRLSVTRRLLQIASAAPAHDPRRSEALGDEALGYLLAGHDCAARERMAARRYAATTRNTVVAVVARIVAPDACHEIEAGRVAELNRAAPVGVVYQLSDLRLVQLQSGANRIELLTPSGWLQVGVCPAPRGER